MACDYWVRLYTGGSAGHLMVTLAGLGALLNLELGQPSP
jgi:hypothetical protein